MNFENILNFSDFIADPTAAIKKAQQQIQEAVEEEERKLKVKAAQQEAENRRAYEAAIAALKQQYEELREAKGLSEIEQTINTQTEQVNSAVSKLESEVEALKAQVKKEQDKRKEAEDTIERIKETAKEKAPKSGTAAHDAMKKFYDSNADSATKDKVRFLPSDEALEYIAQLDAGLTPEEIEEMGYSEVQPNGDESQQTEWGQLN